MNKIAYELGRRLGATKKAGDAAPSTGGGSWWSNMGSKIKGGIQAGVQGIKAVPRYAERMGTAYEGATGTPEQKMQAAADAAKREYRGEAPKPISIRPEDNAGGTNAEGVISIGMDPEERKLIQQHGVERGKQMFSAGQKGGTQGGQGGQGGYGWNPQYTNEYFQRLMGFQNPDEYMNWQNAQSAGMGRALRAASNRRWLRAMFA